MKKIKHLHLYHRVKFLRIILILEPVKVHVLKNLEFVFELHRLAMSLFYKMKFSLVFACVRILTLPLSGGYVILTSSLIYPSIGLLQE